MKRRHPLFLAILFSVLLHLFLLGLGATFSVLVPPEENVAILPVNKPVIVDLIPKGMEIADISPPKEEKTPEKAHFLGEYDSSVKEETVTVSKRPGGGTSKKGSEALGEGKTSGEKSAVPAEEKPQQKPEKSLKQELTEKLKLPSKDGMTFEEKPQKKLAMKTPEKPTLPSEGGKKRQLSGEEDYFNGFSEDYFPNYKIGDHTYLNVLKYPKIGYFVRLKKIFRTTFNPVPALRGSLIQVSRGEIDVVLAVSVDRMGKLSELKVIRSSGIESYDDEAMRTIRESAPFAVPPSELLDNESLLRMAWTFTVYL